MYVWAVSCKHSVSVQWTRFDFCGWTRNTSVIIHGVRGPCRKNWQEPVWLCLLVESGCSYYTGWKCFKHQNILLPCTGQSNLFKITYDGSYNLCLKKKKTLCVVSPWAPAEFTLQVGQSCRNFRRTTLQDQALFFLYTLERQFCCLYIILKTVTPPNPPSPTLRHTHTKYSRVHLYKSIRLSSSSLPPPHPLPLALWVPSSSASSSSVYKDTALAYVTEPEILARSVPSRQAWVGLLLFSDCLCSKRKEIENTIFADLHRCVKIKCVHDLLIYTAKHFDLIRSFTDLTQ